MLFGLGAMVDKKQIGLEKNAANFQALSPVTFLENAVITYPNKAAVIYGDITYTYLEFDERCRRLASALVQSGIKKGDTVSIMAPNVPAMIEAHYAVPAIGAVLNSLNIRLDAEAIAFCLNHGKSKLLITDKEFSPIITAALKLVKRKMTVINIDDPNCETGELIGKEIYEDFLNRGDANYCWPGPEDEWDSMSLLYTSGTTGDPKGVVYHHRGAYLNALGNTIAFNLDAESVYLWTLPLFHCDGWTYPWAVVAAGGTQVCLRRVVASDIFNLIKTKNVTHMCGAPIVLNMMIHAPEQEKQKFNQIVKLGTGGASPPSTVITAMEEMGFAILHMYGATEAYGPVVHCAIQKSWSNLSIKERAQKMARQGVGFPTLEKMMVADPDTMLPVPRDGKTVGEVMMRGNTIMKGYLDNPVTTAKTLAGGWYHSGDLAVWHEDNYIEIKDRSKDIIISGGENISSLEVEEVLFAHPAIMEAAVVAKPDEKWGEVPCAFVSLLPDAPAITEDDVIQFCRSNLAHYKCPKEVRFCSLPKTSTGKIQKFKLRELAV